MLPAEVEWSGTPQGDANQQRMLSSSLSESGSVGAREPGKGRGWAESSYVGAGGGIGGRVRKCGRMGLPGVTTGAEGGQYVLVVRSR